MTDLIFDARFIDVPSQESYDLPENVAQILETESTPNNKNTPFREPLIKLHRLTDEVS